MHYDAETIGFYYKYRYVDVHESKIYMIYINIRRLGLGMAVL